MTDRQAGERRFGVMRAVVAAAASGAVRALVAWILNGDTPEK
ncbi:hypothetical protein [Streptomyces sp. Ag82_O1-15]|nr:hypothetical protein [Streptomyces sp. Ag82_O1-15]